VIERWKMMILVNFGKRRKNKITDLEKDILEIIKAHVGFSDAITQYEMTQRINDMGGQDK
jgi:hypothetical protein